MLYEECHHPVTNLVNGSFKEYFIPLVYDEQEGDVQEEGHTNFLYEECNQHVETFVSNVFENFSFPIYDECKDGYLNNAPQKPAGCNNRLDHQD